MSATLRPATAADSGLLFRWVNMPDSRAGKLMTQGAIGLDEHSVWFTQRLADPSCRLWIIMADGEPRGQLRMTSRLEGWEIDIYVASDARRRHLAGEALLQGIGLLRNDIPDVPVIARVKRENVASRKLFKSVGFRLARETNDHLIFTF